MQYRLPARLLMIIGGLIPLSIGIMHLFLPLHGFDSVITDAMDAKVRTHFVDLSLYAIAVFLIGFAFISLITGISPINRMSFAIALVMTFIWFMRSFLEILYPVELALFGMHDLSLKIFAVSSTAAILYFFSAIFFIKYIKDRDRL